MGRLYAYKSRSSWQTVYGTKVHQGGEFPAEFSLSQFCKKKKKKKKNFFFRRLYVRGVKQSTKGSDNLAVLDFSVGGDFMTDSLLIFR